MYTYKIVPLTCYPDWFLSDGYKSTFVVTVEKRHGTLSPYKNEKDKVKRIMKGLDDMGIQCSQWSERGVNYGVTSLGVQHPRL